jgi:hypothetical protein
MVVREFAAAGKDHNYKEGRQADRYGRHESRQQGGDSSSVAHCSEDEQQRENKGRLRHLR